MISIMSRKEFDSARFRKVIEESDLVLTISLDKDGLPEIHLAKNRFGSIKTLRSMLEMIELISNYMKLVL